MSTESMSPVVIPLELQPIMLSFMHDLYSSAVKHFYVLVNEAATELMR